MTDPDEGFFSHLDDPAAPMPGRDALDGGAGEPAFAHGGVGARRRA